MIDFLRYRFATALISLAIIGSSIGLYCYKIYSRGYAFSYSVDFTGGTQVLFKFEAPMSGSHLSEILESRGWPGTVTREFSPTEVLVRVKEFVSDTKGLAGRMQHAVMEAVPDNRVEILQTEAVGAGVGQELRTKAFKAIVYSLIAILIYIGLVFWSFAFAVGAVVSLAHDAIVMLAVFLVLDRDISINVIGAMLAVLGYSINDTIVIYAQIRKHLRAMKNVPLDVIVNQSINQTLRRTILTSLATTLAVVSILVLGGPALRDMALTLMVGIVFGTYSSIYIASPVMMLLYKDDKKA